MLRVYNTSSRTIEDFHPLHPPNVTYYSCGPTVYDYAHIGHARTFVFADMLQRILTLNGYEVKRVMNITDVGHLTSDSDEGEDKMEKGAKREQKSVWDIAQYYTRDFFRMLAQLNIAMPEIICNATDFIPQMIALVQVLEKKGHTYRIADGIYFDTATFPAYGALTGISREELQKRLRAGARVEQVAGKRHPTDFALWKFSYPDGRSFDSAGDDVAAQRQMEWDSPWGRGFPGWHIECSAMSMHYLGDTLDIHTGGVDHIPIHHTNEIAQSEAATGKPFVRYWLHAEHLLIDGQKMSKSLHNFYRLKDVEDKGFSPLALRYLFLNTSYRKQMNFTWASLEGAQTAWEHLRELAAVVPKPDSSSPAPASQDGHFHSFVQALNDDMNTAQALAIVWDVMKSDIPVSEKAQFVQSTDRVLGLGLETGKETEEQHIPAQMQALLQKREQLRQSKQWAEADAVRTSIENNGYFIEDTPQGARLRKKRA